MGSRHFKVDESEAFLRDCKKETERHESVLLMHEKAEAVIDRLLADAKQNPGYAAKDRLFAELLAHHDEEISGLAWRIIADMQTETIEDENGFLVEVIK